MRKALGIPLLLARRLVLNSRCSSSVLTDALPQAGPRSVVIVNGVTGPPRMQPPRARLEEPVRLLYVGRLSERKGPGDAIEAVRLLGFRGVDAHLDIVGAVFPGNELFEDDLRRQVEAARLDGRVRFHGFTADVWPYLAACDVLLVPSRTDESFGNTAVEAILAARPVVATRIRGLVEATTAFDASLLVAPSAPAEIADAVERVVTHWNEFRAHALNDAPRAAHRYSRDRYQSAVTDVLRSLLSREVRQAVRSA